MSDKHSRNHGSYRKQPGIILLVTLVLLVILSTLGYTLTSRVAAQRHRSHYLIDYQTARYACDSAVKYALAALGDINSPQLVERPNEPDFSDLFALDEAEYKEFLEKWAEEFRLRETNDIENANDVNGMNDLVDIDEVNELDPNKLGTDDPNSFEIRGPYGPPWPFITKPAEFEIASAKVKIEIEDENAKYPIGWALLEDKKVRREAEAGFEIFCEWMDVNDFQIDDLESQLEEIYEIKPFKMDFEPIKPPKSKRRARHNRRASRRKKTSKRTNSPAVKTISVDEQVLKQSADFSKLLHSSLIDIDVLAKPTIISEERKESALKYMGMWGSRKVNINTAPRHVLEATFVFGGDEVEIAEEIIQRRRGKVFEDIDDLKKALFRYSVSVEKCKKYITTVSTVFTIKVTAISGVAKASTIIAIQKNGKKIKKIAAISGG